jgi:predicted ester cyclase
MEDIPLSPPATTPKAKMPPYQPDPCHKHLPRPRRFSILVIKVLAYLLVALTLIAAIVVGAVYYTHYRTTTAHTSHTLSNPPPVVPVFSTGPNNTVALGCFGRDVERKGKDPYMPGLFYQYSSTFSRADGLHAAGLFCDDFVKEDIVMGIPKNGKMEMVEMTYETFFGSKKVAVRAQWDVLGEYDRDCRNGARKLEFGAGTILHPRADVDIAVCRGPPVC